EVALQVLRRNPHPGLHQGDLLADDHRVIDVPQLHADQVEDADLRSGQQALDIEPHEAEEQNEHEQENEQGDPRHDKDPDVLGADVFGEERVQHGGGSLSGGGFVVATGPASTSPSSRTQLATLHLTRSWRFQNRRGSGGPPAALLPYSLELPDT